MNNAIFSEEVTVPVPSQPKVPKVIPKVWLPEVPLVVAPKILTPLPY